LALSYHDRAKCHFLTNMWRPGIIQNPKNNSVPLTVQDYRLHMGTVDRVDRSALKSTWPHRNKRWSMAFFWYLLGLCVSNAHKIYNESTGQNISLTSFRDLLVMEWENLLNESKSAHHKLTKSAPKRRCAVCKTLDPNIGKTILRCNKCNVYLHKRCFGLYHRDK
jgi:hypothetical protein